MDDKVSLIKKGIEVEPPPSQEGREYILTQVKHYIEVAEEQVQTGLKELSKDAEEYLLAHDWHGREQILENTVKKACILSDGQMLKLEDFDIKDRPMKSIGIGKFVELKLQGYMRNINNFEKFNLYETVKLKKH
jgi:DNA-binding NtrC family response regulator